MATTIAEQVCAALEQALQTGAATLTPAPKVERDRLSGVNTRPALLLFAGEDQSDDGEMGKVSHRMPFTIECHVDGDAAAAATLAGHVVRWLLADTTLGGLAVDLQVLAVRPDTVQGDGRKKTCIAEIEASADFWTRHGDPFSLAP